MEKEAGAISGTTSPNCYHPRNTEESSRYQQVQHTRIQVKRHGEILLTKGHNNHLTIESSALTKYKKLFESESGRRLENGSGGRVLLCWNFGDENLRYRDSRDLAILNAVHDIIQILKSLDEEGGKFMMDVTRGAFPIPGKINLVSHENSCLQTSDGMSIQMRDSLELNNGKSSRVPNQKLAGGVPPDQEKLQTFPRRKTETTALQVNLKKRKLSLALCYGRNEISEFDIDETSSLRSVSQQSHANLKLGSSKKKRKSKQCLNETNLITEDNQIINLKELRSSARNRRHSNEMYSAGTTEVTPISRPGNTACRSVKDHETERQDIISNFEIQDSCSNLEDEEWISTTTVKNRTCGSSGLQVKTASHDSQFPLRGSKRQRSVQPVSGSQAHLQSASTSQFRRRKIQKSRQAASGLTTTSPSRGNRILKSGQAGTGLQLQPITSQSHRNRSLKFGEARSGLQLQLITSSPRNGRLKSGEAGSELQLQLTASQSRQYLDESIPEVENAFKSSGWRSNDQRMKVTTLIEQYRYLQKLYKNQYEESGEIGLRPDIKAGNYLKANGHAINSSFREIGPIPGVEIGDIFFFREEMFLLGVHRTRQSGIDYINSSTSGYTDKNGNRLAIAVSVVSSGGYKDNGGDADGEYLVYSGAGRAENLSRNLTPSNQKSKGQDQELIGGNLALKNSCNLQVPIRVIRGFKSTDPIHIKRSFIYQYAGLYTVRDYYFDIGVAGNKVWKFILIRRKDQPQLQLQVYV